VSIAELLSQSMAAHKSARPAGKNSVRPTDWKARLKTAADLRKQALEQDPERKDPAWSEEERHTTTGRNTHEFLMAFYLDVLGEV